MTQDEIIEIARQAGMEVHSSKGQIRIGSAVFTGDDTTKQVEAFAKLVAAHAVDKDRKEFDIDELCARQNKIGYKQGYNAGVLAEREACAVIAEEWFCGCGRGKCPEGDLRAQDIANSIKARGES